MSGREVVRAFQKHGWEVAAAPEVYVKA